jgi:hypothetical protein
MTKTQNNTLAAALAASQKYDYDIQGNFNKQIAWEIHIDNLELKRWER